MIHVCSLARLPATVEEVGARHIVTLINDETKVVRPQCVRAEDHLFLGMHDIATELEGFRAPAEEHVHQLIAFAERWHRRTPLVVHCWAGVSRSTAGAFIAACALNPKRDEARIARAIREGSPTATPNARLVALADNILGRSGRMIAAIDAIGRGTECFEGAPFRLDLE
ncbi:MAG TPA: protein tyrosine phosphatase [Xanthobacteraceae bacterium]|nr:protein tyrosine phosphatase [Xanthobacteraceae bacterium]